MRKTKRLRNSGKELLSGLERDGAIHCLKYTIEVAQKVYKASKEFAKACKDLVAILKDKPK